MKFYYINFPSCHSALLYFLDWNYARCNECTFGLCGKINQDEVLKPLLLYVRNICVESKFWPVELKPIQDGIRFRLLKDEMTDLVMWRILNRDPSGYGKWRKIWKEDFEKSLRAMIYKESGNLRKMCVFWEKISRH